MTRLTRILVAVLIVVGMSLGQMASAQPPARGPGGGPGRGGMGMGMGFFGGMRNQGSSLLRMPAIQKELKLTDDQKQLLKDLNDTFDKENQQSWSALRDIPAEERQAKMAEIQQASAKRSEELRTQVDVVLTPAQRDQLKQITFQMTAGSMLGAPQMLEQLGVTEEQKRKISENREQLQEKLWQLQHEMNGKAVEVLTPEQRTKLEEMMKQPPRMPGPPR